MAASAKYLQKFLSAIMFPALKLSGWAIFYLRFSLKAETSEVKVHENRVNIPILSHHITFHWTLV